MLQQGATANRAPAGERSDGAVGVDRKVKEHRSCCSGTRSVDIRTDRALCINARASTQQGLQRRNLAADGSLPNRGHRAPVHCNNSQGDDVRKVWDAEATVAQQYASRIAQTARRWPEIA
jgi:hypothetical protein